MNELIKITNQNGIESVNARELHGFLESKQDFSTWIKNRIEKYNFAENVDFVRFHNFVEGDLNGYGNKTYKDYYLSINMAKELSMIENNEKGRQARRYFIECEKKLKQPLALPLNDLLFFHFKSTLFLVKPVDHLYEDHLVLSYQEHTISGLVQIGYPNVDTTSIRSDGRYCSAYYLPTNELKAIGKIVGRVEMDQDLDHLEELPGYIHGVKKEPIRFQVLNVVDYRYDSREMQEILRDLVEAKEENIKLKQKELKQLKKKAVM